MAFAKLAVNIFCDSGKANVIEIFKRLDDSNFKVALWGWTYDGMAKGRNKLLEFLEIEVKGVYNLIKSGELSFARIGRQWGAL